MPVTDILVVDKSQEAAEEINNQLRNSGISIHVCYVESEATLQKTLASSQPVMAIFGELDQERIALADAVALLDRETPIPFYMRRLVDDAAPIREALRLGASGIIDMDDPTQLQSAVEREMHHAEALQRLEDGERQLKDIGDRYNLLLDSSREAIAYIHEGLHIYANASYLALFDMQEFSELEGMSILELVRLQDEKQDLKQLLKQINKGSLPEGTVPALSILEDKERQLTLAFSPARYNEEHCVQLLVREKQASAELAEELERLKRLDPLTGMMNRAGFLEYLQELVSVEDSGEGTVAVLQIEADRFAELTNELGDSKTDAVILDLAEVLQGLLEESGDCCARFNDQVFAACIRRPDKQSAVAVAESMIRAYREHIIDLGDKSITNTCSVGISFRGNQTESGEELLAQTRNALQAAQTEGGDTFVRYRPRLATVAGSDEDKAWVERIRHALNTDDYFMIHQPIVDLEQDAEPYHESFTCLREDGRDLLPEDYEEVASRTNMGSSIDRVVLPSLLGYLADPNNASEVSTYLVNVSSNSVEDFSFPAWLKNQLEDHGIPGRKLILQLPSQFVASNLKATQRLIEELDGSGCRFAMGQFDNSKRAMQSMEHLKLQFIKLHSELSNQIISDNTLQDAVRRIVDAAERQKIQVIAGEVRDAASLATLWQCGVKLVQGDFLKEKSRVVGA